MKHPLPQSLIRFADKALDIDLEKRTVRNTVTTKHLARDGGIVLPEGIITKFFEQNPVVKIRHGKANDARPLVAGRCLSLIRTSIGLDAVTQFADTDLGRDWAYMYGLNPKGEVFMRAFSFGWASIRTEVWTLEQVRQYLGNLYDEQAVSSDVRRWNEVWVSAESEMHEYSVCEVGADREALSRAFSDGVRTAGDLLAQMDLTEARAEITSLRAQGKEFNERINRIETEMKALARNEAAAADRGNTAAILDQLRSLRETAKR